MPRGVYDRKPAARGANPGAAPGRAEVSAPACIDCRYLAEANPAREIGECRRDSHFEAHTFRDWCGQFEPKRAVPR